MANFFASLSKASRKPLDEEHDKTFFGFKSASGLDWKDSTITGQLFEAVQSGKASKLAQLLKKGANYQATDDEGDSLLHYCAGSGQLECLQLLLEHSKGKLDVNLQGWKGFTALHAAASFGKTECLRLLLDFGADPKAKGQDGSTPLHMAAKSGFRESIEALIDAGADIDAVDRESGTAISRAGRAGHANCVEELLESNANASIPSGPLGYLPIHWATSNGHYECVELLLTKNDVKLKDRIGNTPLHIASANGHASCVRLLLEKGASISDVNNYQENPFHLACWNGHHNCLLLLVLENPDSQLLDLKSRDDKGMTPLHRAIEGGNPQCISKLMEYIKFFDINSKDSMGNTALHLAAKQGSNPSIDILLSKGATIDAQNNDLATPLHLATIFGNLRVVEELLERGAKPSIKNSDNKDAYDLALRYGRSDIAALLNKRINQSSFQRSSISAEATKKLKTDMNNLIAENQKLMIKLKTVERNAEIDHLEKERLEIELAMLKTENQMLRQQLSSSQSTAGKIDPTKSALTDILSNPFKEETMFTSPSKSSRNSARVSQRISSSTGHSVEILQMQNQALRSKVINLTEEIAALENQLLTTQRQKTNSIGSQLRFGYHRTASDAQDSAPAEEEFFKDCDTAIFSKENDKEVPQIKAATVDKLIERLTYPNHPDLEYMIAFLLTYRTFMTPIELLEKIILRYCITPSPQISAIDEKLKEYTEKVQAPIKLRVVNVLKHWIEEHFYDFEDNEELEKQILKFIKTIEQTGLEKPADQLSRVFTKKKNERSTKSKDTLRVAISPGPSSPPSHYPSQSQTSWMEWNDEEIARQLTMLDFELFKAISPAECLNQSWMKTSGAIHIKELTKNFNKLSNFVWSEIVKMKDAKERVACLSKLISIAKHCLTLNNFNTCIGILSGLQHFTVYRLKHTWDELPKSAKDNFAEMKSLLSSHNNWAKYRDHLHFHTSPPCLPFMGVYLTDLVFVEEGNPDKLKVNLINFSKRRKIAVIIREIQQYQTTVYNFQIVHIIRDFFDKYNGGLVDDIGYKISLEIEPREATSPTQV